MYAVDKTEGRKIPSDLKRQIQHPLPSDINDKTPQLESEFKNGIKKGKTRTLCGSRELYLSQFAIWLWLASISKMSSISSSIRNGCCDTGSSSGQE